MKLIHMRPGQIQAAAVENLPLLIACGVVEYHGPHLPVGTDYLIASSIVEEIEHRAPERCVLAPGLPLGPTGSWAGGPEDGEMDLAGETFFQYVKPILRFYLQMGFERIRVCQHHQGHEGTQTLCLRRAASELALEQGYAQGGGAGWGRAPRDECPAVFGRIGVYHPTSFVKDGSMTGNWGHAGYAETEYIRCTHPETVDLDQLQHMKPLLPWLEDAHTADGKAGHEWMEKCVTSWLEAL